MMTSASETLMQWDAEPDHYVTLAAKLFHKPEETVTVYERYVARNELMVLLFAAPDQMPQA